MSIFVAVTIECDACGAVQELGDSNNEKEGVASARDRGWRVGSDDLCPSCAEIRADIDKEQG